MTDKDSEELMYSRSHEPFGRSWEEWAALWCQWLLSLPREINPAVDDTGNYSSQNQTYTGVWFLAGTFGNNIPVKRRCKVPKFKAIFFPILEKEDSFTEDIDLRKPEELAMRAKNSMDRLIYLDASLDGKRLPNLKDYRVRSHFFDLMFPENNVYDVTPGLTRSVCEGYWVFLKPLPVGTHEIHFTGAVYLPNHDIVTDQMKSYPIYRSIIGDKDNDLTFNVNVTYQIEIK
jgi:hypothetical protein